MSLKAPPWNLHTVASAYIPLAKARPYAQVHMGGEGKLTSSTGLEGKGE